MTDSDQEFLKTVKYGLIVVNSKGERVCFTGYAEEPTERDRKALYVELKAEPFFDDQDWDNMIIEDATPEEVEKYIRVVE